MRSSKGSSTRSSPASTCAGGTRSQHYRIRRASADGGAALYEVGGESRFDKVVLVTAPKKLREARGRVLTDERESRLLSDREKAKKADYVYVNTGTFDDLDDWVAGVLTELEGRLVSRRLAVALLVLVGVLVASAWVGPRRAPWYERLVYPMRYEHIVRGHAEHYDLDPALVAGVIFAESEFDAKARSSAGAIGLMQLLPETAQGIAKRTGGTAFVVDDLYDPEVNIRYGSGTCATCSTATPTNGLRLPPGRAGERRCVARGGGRRLPGDPCLCRACATVQAGLRERLPGRARPSLGPVPDLRIERYAQLLVECVDVQPRCKSWFPARPLPGRYSRSSTRLIARRGAYAISRITLSGDAGLERAWVREAPLEPLSDPAALHLDLLRLADALIVVSAPENTRDAASISQDRLAALQAGLRPSMERVLRHEVPWVACQYPTPALAQEARMSTGGFEDFLGACLRTGGARRADADPRGALRRR